MAQFLTNRERDILIRLRDHSSNPTITRRAQIVLLSDEEMSTSHIAAAISLSAGQVRYWRREWDKRGLGIFPEEAVSHMANGDRDQEASGVLAEGVNVPAGTAGHDAKPAAPDRESTIDVPPPEPDSAPGIDRPRQELALQATVGILPTDSMAEAGRKVLLYHFERMLLNEPGSRRGEDIEAVHDMRVATRRMRSAFRLFEPYYKPAKIEDHWRGSKKIGDVLGKVRDLEVFLDKAQTFADKHPGTDLTPLFEIWQGRLTKARQRLITYLDSRDFDAFVTAFHAFLTTPGKGARPQPAPEELEPYEVQHVLPQLIYRLYEQVRVYDAAVEEGDIPTLHALRIELKRLRYALEFFEEVLGPEARRVIREVKTLQDHLGDLNDAYVAEAMLRDFVAEHERQHSGTPRFMRRPDVSGVAAYLAAQQADMVRLVETFPQAWAKFTDERVRRDLALAVAAL